MQFDKSWVISRCLEATLPVRQGCLTPHPARREPVKDLNGRRQRLAPYKGFIGVPPPSHG
jgi:hypothetical protein